MDATLDDIQNELREPRYSAYRYRGSETASQSEHDYRFLESRDRQLRAVSYEYLLNPRTLGRLRRECLAELPEELQELGGVTLLVLGRSVIGCGVGLADAMGMAKRRGYDPRSCRVAFIPTPGQLFI